MQLFHQRVAISVSLIVLTLALTHTSATADDIASPDIVAASAIVIDAHTGDVLFEQNATEPRAMASLTKLFTALVALELITLDTPMTVEPDDLVGEASMGLVAGDTLRFETLLHGLMLPSGNDAASTIARVVGGGSPDAFIMRANKRVAELGLTQTRLVNPHGLDAEGHFSTARDIAALTMYALAHQPDIAAAIHTPSHTGDGYSLFNTNRLLDVYPGLIGGKTGVTDAAGYCLMQVAEIDGQRVLVVLLGSTWESWYADAETLLDHGFEALAIPGRTTTSSPITFPTVAEQPPVQSPVVHASGLTVANQPDGSRIVASPALYGARAWSPWFWLGTVAVTAPSLAFIALQLQKLFALMAYGPPRRRPARSRSGARSARQTAALLSATAGTQPFPLVISHGSTFPVSFDPWAGPGNRDSRRAERERARDASPAFAGD
ncbi:MAG TPA: D-alanyl-D-alanine carboxypeptidase family protein [Thermomicrobiales bacterium]|nr:D-alanyl-D-alanine carboxypeptidase family protein [Thermomicrobiales bacterium]